MARYIPPNNSNTTNFMRDSKALASDFDNDKSSVWEWLGAIGFIFTLFAIIVFL